MKLTAEQRVRLQAKLKEAKKEKEISDYTKSDYKKTTRNRVKALEKKTATRIDMTKVGQDLTRATIKEKYRYEYAKKYNDLKAEILGLDDATTIRKKYAKDTLKLEVEHEKLKALLDMSSEDFINEIRLKEARKREFKRKARFIGLTVLTLGWWAKRSADKDIRLSRGDV